MSNKVAIHDPERRNAIKWVDGPAQVEIGKVPDHRVPVIDKHGRMRGNVSRHATETTAMRLGLSSARLGTHGGRDAWIERSAPKGVTVAAQQTGALDAAVHAASLRAAKGSVGKAHRPETHVRPRRG